MTAKDKQVEMAESLCPASSHIAHDMRQQVQRLLMVFEHK